GALEDTKGMLLTDRPAAALPPSYYLTGTACGREPAALVSRRGGTDESLGRGAGARSRAPGNGGAADPCKGVWCSRVLTPLGEPVRWSREWAASRAVPVVTSREKEISAPVHRPYLDRRGHKRVRPGRRGTELHTRNGTAGRHAPQPPAHQAPARGPGQRK